MNTDHTIAILGFNNHKTTLSVIKKIRDIGCQDTILFFDNGSQPSFESLIKDDNYIYYRKEKNIYVNPAWNEIFDLVKTKYLTLLNNDCFIESDNYFKEVLAHMEKNDIVLSSCKTKNISFYNIFTKFLYKIIFLRFKLGSLTYSSVSRRQGWLMTINLKKYMLLDYKIPKYLKIWYGDDWIWSQIIKNNLKYALYKNRYALHIKSSSSSLIPNIIQEDIDNINQYGEWYKEITNKMHSKKWYSRRNRQI
tara:strand:- start:160 stop:909 length:750 start_codon:yes stop_codon:yes gene_type:complete